MVELISFIASEILGYLSDIISAIVSPQSFWLSKFPLTGESFGKAGVFLTASLLITVALKSPDIPRREKGPNSVLRKAVVLFIWIGLCAPAIHWCLAYFGGKAKLAESLVLFSYF